MFKLLASVSAMKITLKMSVSNDRCCHFARDVCTTANDTPYARSFSSPLNRAYRMSLRHSVLEHRPSIGAMSVCFSTQPIFPLLMLRQCRIMAHMIRSANGGPSMVGGPNIIQYISDVRLPHVKIWQRYIQ